LFQGTLLADFFNDCIRRLSDFFKEEFTIGPDEATRPVGPARKRLTTFLNLAVQLFNPTNGSFVFISREEDQILRGFYSRLRALLQSHTFCAMFDGARQYPDKYPFPNVDAITIFGKGSQQRLRVSPNGRLAYAVGGNSNRIAVYDVQKNEMAVELEFPSGVNALVQDVAFSKDGSQLFAVATLNNRDTAFAVADVIGLNHIWRKPPVVCDVLFVTLATAPTVSNDVYAISKGKGLYQINPSNVNPTPTPIFPFNAVGHLVIFGQEGIAYATAAAAGAAAGNVYNSVVRVNLKSTTNSPPAIPLPAVNNQPVTGQDDIALSFLPGQPARLYVVVNPPSGFNRKQVMTFEAASGKFLGQRDLGESATQIRLAFNPATNRMVVAFEESYRLGVLNSDDQIDPTFRFPTQISPLSIAVSPDNKRVYALNFASNTLSSISADLLDPKRQLPLKDLVDYRTSVLNAFFDLAGGFFQYLKDCLCDHFLVNCPTCDAGDKLYLGVISVRNRQVNKVCNFSLRKYVKSFPTVEYWLSLIPILPFLKRAVESFCCSALPNYFGRQNAPHATVTPNEITLADNRVKSSTVRSSVEFVKTADFLQATLEGMGKLKSSGSLILDAITRGTRKPSVAAPSLEHSDLAGQPLDEAKRKLQAANISVVSVEPYNPDAGLENLLEFSRAPLRLEQGAQVRLITKDDKVLYYASVQTEPPQMKGLRDEVSTLKQQLLDMERKHQEALAARDRDLQLNIKAVSELKEQVAKLSRGRPARAPKRKSETEE
jgi:DNA-binding beta-propeller fold protein YncE